MKSQRFWVDGYKRFIFLYPIPYPFYNKVKEKPNIIYKILSKIQEIFCSFIWNNKNLIETVPLYYLSGILQVNSFKIKLMIAWISNFI